MVNSFPTWLIATDYILAFIMLILVIKFILNLFFIEGSKTRIFLFFTRITSPILNLTFKLTPYFIVQPLIPLYLAWLIFMIRIYVLPIFLGYSYLGTFAFIFEKHLFYQIKSLVLGLALSLNYGI